MDPPSLPRSYFSSWTDGNGSLDVITHSTPTSINTQNIDHAHIIFHQYNKCILIGAPPNMENFMDLTSPIHETWLVDLQSLASFRHTTASQAISSHIHSTPYLPMSLQEYFIDAIISESQDFARTIASMGHRAVRMIFHLNITVNMLFDDDYNNSSEDDEDAMAGNVEIDDVTVGNDVIQPLDLHAVEIVGGLSPEAIANHLTIDNFMETNQSSCVICLQNISRGTPAGWLPCCHVFHPSCITDWLKRSGTCPICRCRLSDIGD